VLAQGSMCGLVLGAVTRVEVQFDRDITPAAGGAGAHAFIHHPDSGSAQKARDFDLKMSRNRPHGGDFKDAGELETVVGVVGVDGHERAL